MQENMRCGMSKIGVYICKCGGTIPDGLEIESLVKAAWSLKGVSTVRVHELLCGQEGQSVILDDIQNGIVDRVVTVACSPKMHQQTFLKVCEKGSLNPYLLNMVNIREQCVWMISDKGQATEKAIRMMKAGVARMLFQEALPQKEIDINPDVMVVGAGIAGIEAALELAKANRKVYLIDNAPALGGLLPRLEHTYPSNECAPCILAPRLAKLLECGTVEIIPSATIKTCTGYGGSFTVHLEEEAGYVDPDACISCLMCVETCPVEVPNPFNNHRDLRKAIDFPFPGCVPKAPYLDEHYCLRFKGQECAKCRDACEFNAIDLDKKPRERVIPVGSIILAIGGQNFDVSRIDPALTEQKGVVLTGIEFERLLSTTGATRGKILLPSGQPPQSVIIVHCVGSRNERYLPYCSGICCKYALKHSHAIKKQLPECRVTHIYSDLCLEGINMQDSYTALRRAGVIFERWQFGEKGLAEFSFHNGKIIVSGYNGTGHSPVNLESDMVLLATGLAPHPDLSLFAKQLFLSERNGFVVVKHEKINAVETTADGVYVAGTVSGPKDITASVTEAKAAAGEILATYIDGRKLKLEPAIAHCDETVCGRCQSCILLCPYHAPYFDKDTNTVRVNEVLCQGCGTCVAACPSGAMIAKHFTKNQIKSEIKGMLDDVV